MMEALTEDYVRTAAGKGLSTRRVNYVHALRNALIPIITLLGLTLPAIVSVLSSPSPSSTTRAWGLPSSMPPHRTTSRS